MVEVLEEISGNQKFGEPEAAQIMKQLGERTEQMFMKQEGDSDEELKEEEREGLSLHEPMPQRWAKEALNLVTQHLSEE